MQNNFTPMGKKVIPVSLVGINSVYQVLKTPQRSAYPKGDEVAYRDDYIAALNQAYSLEDALGTHTPEIAQKKGLERFVMDSPLQNTEGEDVLAHMLISSAQAGVWQPWIIDVPHLTDAPDIPTATEYLRRVEAMSPNYNHGKIEGGLLFGLSVAKRGNLALPIQYEEKVIVVPFQLFIEYCASQK